LTVSGKNMLHNGSTKASTAATSLCYSLRSVVRQLI